MSKKPRGGIGSARLQRESGESGKPTERGPTRMAHRRTRPPASFEGKAPRRSHGEETPQRSGRGRSGRRMTGARHPESPAAASGHLRSPRQAGGRSQGWQFPCQVAVGGGEPDRVGRPGGSAGGFRFGEASGTRPGRSPGITRPGQAERSSHDHTSAFRRAPLVGMDRAAPHGASRGPACAGLAPGFRRVGRDLPVLDQQDGAFAGADACRRGRSELDRARRRMQAVARGAVGQCRSLDAFPSLGCGTSFRFPRGRPRPR